MVKNDPASPKTITFAALTLFMGHEIDHPSFYDYLCYKLFTFISIL